MIDTLVLNFPGIFIPKSIYSKWDDDEHHRKGDYLYFWHGFTVYLRNRAAIQFTYYPSISDGLLKIQFSLPNAIYGNNVQMVYNIVEAIDIANSNLPNIKGIPEINLWNGLLDRVDVCYNFQVGNLIPWYVKSLQVLEYPYRRTRPYNSQGVQFQNTQAILKFYDKARERRDDKDERGAIAAKGILRMEAELHSNHVKAHFESRIGSKKPTLRDISVHWALDVTENELDELNLLGCSIGTVDTTFKVLREKYGHWEALALIGLLQTNMTYPSKELFAEDAGLHPNSIGRHLKKKFVENGIPPTLTTHSEPLPPLVVDRDYVLEQSKLPIKQKRLF